MDPAAPQLLVLVEQAAGDPQPLEVGPDDLAASDSLFCDEASPFEDRDFARAVGPTCAIREGSSAFVWPGTISTGRR